MNFNEITQLANEIDVNRPANNSQVLQMIIKTITSGKLDKFINALELCESEYSLYPDLEHKNKAYQTFFDYACMRNAVEICEYLLNVEDCSVSIYGNKSLGFKHALDYNSDKVLNYLILEKNIHLDENIINYLERSRFHLMYESQQANRQRYDDLMNMFRNRDLHNNLEENLEKKNDNLNRIKI